MSSSNNSSNASEAFYFGFSPTTSDDITDVVGDLARSAPVGHNPTQSLVQLLGDYQDGIVDKDSLKFIFARSHANDRIVGCLVLWMLTRPRPNHPEPLPISRICDAEREGGESRSLKFWHRVSATLKDQLRRGDLPKDRPTAYILFQAVESSFCTRPKDSKKLYDKMYFHAGKRHGIRTLIMGTPEDGDQFGFLQPPLSFQVLAEQETTANQPQDGTTHLYWREP